MADSTPSLIGAAAKTRANGVARFSGFAVGAALEAGDGAVYTGCNVENASYGLSMCAERVALFKALSEGAREFRRIAIVSQSEKPATPCGACRQLLWEFCGDIEVVLSNLDGVTETVSLATLVPRPFDASFL
jgi:cytidine deaminase